MSASSTFKQQVRRNMVALISLAVAVTGLGYNTWCNEVSEHNRNQRLVSIELGESTRAKDRIVSALDEVRSDAHAVLKSLD
jgi:Tfp pilus assembly protein PilO